MGYGNFAFGEQPFGAEGGYGFAGVISTIESPIKKRFLFKIYDSAGNFITTWGDVITEPTFTIDINGGFSEMVLELARLEDDYDEGVSVDYENQIKVYVFDKDSPYTGTLIYSGKISRYTPSIRGNQETIRVTFLSYWWETEQRLLERSGATVVTYTADDPETILKDVLDKFVTAGGKLDYDTGTTQSTGTTVTYSFNTASYQEVLKKILDVSPYDWYLRIGADDKVYYKQKSATADHVLTLGKEISEYEPEKRTENIVNTIYFVGGGTPTKLYKKYVDASSVASYGTHALKYIDERVTTSAVSDTIRDRIFNNLAEPEVRVVLKVLDNSGENYYNERGYDIESLFVGDTVQLRNATSKGNNLWDEALLDVDSWDYNITNAAAQLLQIVRLQYFPDYCIIELSNKQPDFVKRIEEINRKSVDIVTNDNPTTPA